MNKVIFTMGIAVVLISGEAQALWELVPQQVVQANIRAQVAEEHAKKARKSAERAEERAEEAERMTKEAIEKLESLEEDRVNQKREEHDRLIKEREAAEREAYLKSPEYATIVAEETDRQEKIRTGSPGVSINSPEEYEAYINSPEYIERIGKLKADQAELFATPELQRQWVGDESSEPYWNGQYWEY